MVYVLNHLDSSSIVDWFEVADQDEIFLESLRIILTILFDCSCWGFFSRFFLADVNINQICEVTKFWALFSE